MSLSAMSGFHDVPFPLRLARGAVGGPQRRTTVISLANGREVRMAPLSGSRRRWEVASAMLELPALAEITAFFEARHGRLHSFRFRDVSDCSSAHGTGPVGPMDQVLGIGDGVRHQFQLVRRYGDNAAANLRQIQLPWPGSVLVAVDGVALAASGFTVEPVGGQITLALAPPLGKPVTAGFKFDCAARFDTDNLDIAMDAFNAGRTLSVPLVEVVL
jgi:uncharacterized protein (TIGR02217 family)